MWHCGFNPRWSLLVEMIFPLELARVLTSFPKNSFGWEYKPRSSLRTHAFHRTDLKDPDIHVLDGWMPAAKTHPACTIHKDGMWLPLWLDLDKNQKWSHNYAKISPKMVNPRDIAGNAEEEEVMSGRLTMSVLPSCCIVLFCIVLCCVTLYHIALHCFVLHFTALHCRVLYCFFKYYITQHSISQQGRISKEEYWVPVWDLIGIWFYNQ